MSAEVDSIGVLVYVLIYMRVQCLGVVERVFEVVFLNVYVCVCKRVCVSV